jgi:formate hydrogenlyase subunit 3/multisubunit Na+/H+ antiporter MnhD subunit
MTELLLILVPLAAAAAAALWPDDRTRPWFLPAAGLAHTFLAFWLLLHPPEVPFHPWLGLDPLARAILPAVSLLFLACAAYGVPYLRLRAERSNRVFVPSFRGAEFDERGAHGAASRCPMDCDRGGDVVLRAAPALQQHAARF